MACCSRQTARTSSRGAWKHWAMLARCSSRTRAKASRSSRWFSKAVRTGRIRWGHKASRILSSSTMKSNSSWRSSSEGPARAKISWLSHWSESWHHRWVEWPVSRIDEPGSTWLRKCFLDIEVSALFIFCSSCFLASMAPSARRERKWAKPWHWCWCERYLHGSVSGQAAACPQSFSSVGNGVVRVKPLCKTSSNLIKSSWRLLPASSGFPGKSHPQASTAELAAVSE